MALEEASVIDQRFGRIMNHSLAEYHVPVDADSRDRVIFVEEHDSMVNPIGVKGLGEIGIEGLSALEDARFDRCADHPSGDNCSPCNYVRIRKLTDSGPLTGVFRITHQVVLLDAESAPIRWRASLEAR